MERFVSENFVSLSCPINQLQFPKLKTNARIYEYYDSKSLKIPVTGKVPEASSLELELITSVQNKNNAEETLREAQKINVVMAKNLDKRWTDLENKELKFRKTISNFDYFIKANADKRDRTRQKIMDDKSNLQARCDEIDKLSSRMNQFYYIKGRREEMIKSYRKYENFLEAVCSKDFKNVSAILVRYDCLIENKNDIRLKQASLLNDMQIAKKKFLDIVQRNRMVMMELTANMSMLLLRHETAKVKALKWENINEKVKQHVIDLERSLELVLTTINKMYSDMCSRDTHSMYNPNLPLDDKLKFINQHMRVVESIIVGLRTTKKGTKSVSSYG